MKYVIDQLGVAEHWRRLHMGSASHDDSAFIELLPDHAAQPIRLTRYSNGEASRSIGMFDVLRGAVLDAIVRDREDEWSKWVALASGDDGEPATTTEYIEEISDNPTWSSPAEMLRAFHLLRQGNRYLARQLPNGSYRPIQAAKFDLIRLWHGRETAGFYSIRRDNVTRWGSIDFDNHDLATNINWFPAALSEFDRLAGVFAEVWLVESSCEAGRYPGYHVIAFSDVLLPAADMRKLIGSVGDHEVFPKQDALNPSEPRAKGSLIRMPGKHQRKGTWSRIIMIHGRATDAVPEFTNWVESTEQGKLQSLLVNATKGLNLTEQGQRWHYQQKLGGRLKGRATREVAEWVFTEWFHKNAKFIDSEFVIARRQFLDWFDKAKACKVELPENDLSPYNARIEAIEPQRGVDTDRLKETARLMLRAHLHARSKGLTAFWLSSRDIGRHLGCSEQTASRLRSALVKAGMVALEELGYTGVASTYRLLWE